MGLRDEFESAKSHILHQDPLPKVSQAIHKLVDDDTRLLRLISFLSRPWFLLLQSLFRRLLLLFFPLPVHLLVFPKAKGIMSDDITIRSLFLSTVSVRTKVILLKPITLVSVFFKTLLL